MKKAIVNTIRIRLGHESLDVTLAYLKGKDAESEEAQEHANSSSLALYGSTVTKGHHGVAIARNVTFLPYF